MGHNPATRDGQKGERQKIEEKRTPEQIIKDLRVNVKNRLYVAPLDIEFLLVRYDAAMALVDAAAATMMILNSRAETAEAQYQAAVTVITERNHEIASLQAQIKEFRRVYEQENRSISVTAIDRKTADSVAAQLVGTYLPDSEVQQDITPEHHEFVDHGGEA